jgi:predicted nucleic acid-binding protein
MRVYPDSSFLLSLYSVDAHSEAAVTLAKQHQPVFCLTPFSEAEFINAVELGVFVKRYTAREARAVREHFSSHMRSGVFSVSDLPSEAWTFARTLSRRYTAKLGTRSLDVLHVAVARALNAEALFTFDQRQARLARAQGLRVIP